MIPKIIHYCWFGGNPLPELALKYIESWKKYCPDYEIIEWNESNFDVNALQYTKEAYEAKKYAFVADVARLKALYEFGGIYMDTDMELLKNIDDLMNDKFFLGFESSEYVNLAICGSESKSDILQEMLDYYKTHKFMLENNQLNTTTIVTIMTNILSKYGLKLNGELQTVAGCRVYPADYFYPKNFYTNKLNFTNNTYGIHHYDSSWLDEKEKFKIKQRDYYVNKFGIFFGKFIYLINRFFYILKQDGIGRIFMLIKIKLGFK
ncbi:MULTISPECIES: glycosyltransferase family 32 protein [unclassified Campylobacter]|uniref:glycosyltransferase family 32 protein n=1 Tax=unclassified Campylobacter TaxID=2593542 RepID=UPI0022E9F8B0|nr:MULTISPECIES: glycosyltransferase [unclassified Campylobacter]MDA3055541.1 glycosyltransferase [Campylobacter sp. CN_NA1]MDA3064769.1 glycosyltransferase [Campylobacter sp. CN_NE4]MDA3068407.1 glycosyltransferase [Campylobacter sp. CN_NE3]MDA3082280.1 glycosyltransferase [Campylobacter sp. CN_EL2]MDA3083915.1 glycosyltransferase [Campylobacter sp. CN_NE1]